VTPHTTIEQQHWISVNVVLVYCIFCSKANCCLHCMGIVVVGWPQMGQTKGDVSAS